jgi:hypothetical protein
VPDEREVPPPPPINDPSPPPPPQATDAGAGYDTSEELKEMGDAAVLPEGPAQEAVDRATATLGEEDIGEATDRIAGEVPLEAEFERDEDIGDGTNRTGELDVRFG